MALKNDHLRELKGDTGLSDFHESNREHPAGRLLRRVGKNRRRYPDDNVATLPTSTLPQWLRESRCASPAPILLHRS